ncbi:MAG: WbqC family protein [Bacteroidota bacterium]
MVLIESTAYLPPVSWCRHAVAAGELVLEAHEHFQKGSWRNRCEIAGPNGRQLLSIPLVKGKNNKMPVRDVRIAYDEPWQRQHWRSIRTAYGSAPFFEHYAHELTAFYEKKYVFLFDLNLELIEFVLLQKMKWPGMIQLTDVYQPFTPRPTVITPRYPQVFEDKNGFLPDLSVLDLLMCAGKNGLDYLR